jgi:hypothetical protein
MTNGSLKSDRFFGNLVKLGVGPIRKVLKEPKWTDQLGSARGRQIGGLWLVVGPKRVSLAVNGTLIEWQAS